MNEEEMTALQEELAEARAEVERLESTAADREARTIQLESELAGIRDELDRAKSEAISREDALIEEVREGAKRYRALALEGAPDVLDELVTGDSIEEIATSLERARETVEKVRQHVESGQQASRVPAGAPERASTDTSMLSAEEKIRAGLAQRG
jgi:hypothetical protein